MVGVGKAQSGHPRMECCSAFVSIITCRSLDFTLAKRGRRQGKKNAGLVVAFIW